MICRGICLWSYFLPFFSLFTLTRADYYIDNTNQSIIYTPQTGLTWVSIDPNSPFFVALTNGSHAVIDYNRLYGQAVSASFCNSTIPCLINMPFTGSGITIYGLQVPQSPTNLTVTLDGTTLPLPVIFSTSQLAQGSPTAYNVSLYNNQSLPLSFHELTIANNEILLFDYAYVNETHPASTSSSSSSAVPSSSSAPVPSSSSTTSSASRFPVGAVVGGSVGGLVAVAAVIYALWKIRRKTARREEFATQMYTTPFDPDDVRPQMPQPNMEHVPVSSLYSTAAHPGQASRSALQRNSNVSLSADFFTPIDTTIPDSERHSSPSPQGKNFSPAPDSPLADDEIIPNQLTDEQADYLRSMYSRNVPAAAMAVVVERMRHEGRGTGETSSGIMRGGSIATTPPPRYEES